MVYEKKKDAKKVKMSLCISENNFEDIANLAIQTDCSYSYIVNHILKQYFSEKKK